MQAEFSLSQHLDQQHPYYHLLMQQQPKLKEIFQVRPTDVLKEPPAPFPLRIYGRENSTHIGATFLYFFRMPVRAEEYLAIMRDYSFQKKVDTNIDEFKPYKDINAQETEVLYISYKRVLIVMPRYFIYVRFAVRIDNQIWVIAVSDPDSPVIKDKTKGEIVLTVIRLQDVQGGCEISVYSQVDMKMKLKFQTAVNTGSAQIAKYLRNIHSALKA